MLGIDLNEGAEEYQQVSLRKSPCTAVKYQEQHNKEDQWKTVLTS